LVPIGVPGELYIGGDGLARGYVNNPEQTAAKFGPRRPGALFEKTAPGPHKNFLLNYLPLTTHHSPLYKTGDLARWLPDGNVEFLGRGDFQVKIRGYRIELGEIENKLAEHPGVREAVVLALNMAPTGKDTGEKYLCAYVVPGSPGILNTAELKEFLSHSLPDYMIPSYFTAIDSIPLNPNGKVDWRALPDPGIEVSNNYEAPRNDTERKLVDIWSEILALDKGAISIHDDFFARGGHSLKAATLVSKIQKEFSIVVPLVEVFKTPTVKGLGEHIGSNLNKGESILPALEDENLVLLRRNTPGIHDIVPLFFIHSGSGEIEAYIELCSRLHGRYNCWGLRVNRVDRMKDFVPRDLGIPELAAQYIKAIKKIQPTGPYFIIGWCVGGTVAFEMNRQLEQSGEKPGTLCLVNAYAPFNKYKGKISTFNIASELSFLKFLKTPLGDKQLKKELKNAVDIPQIWQQVVNYCEERKVPIEILKKAIPKNIVSAIPVSQDASNLDQTKQELREFIYYVNIIRSLGFAREIYNPLGKGSNTSKNNADVYFFGASQSAIANKNQWAGYFEKPVKYYEIEGDHFSIFKIPHVIAFSEEFNRLFYNEQTIRN
ncbi:MAG TPA: thioesterase domain-containing protein, partial [Candidatus Deferrimicrobium sp.]|nr:thioesterase domain-containing protein [Candidatus Deferrimicrobium sp.]